MLNVIILNVIILNVNILNVIMLSVVILNVIRRYAEFHFAECRYAKCRCVYTLQELVVNRKTRSHFQSLTHRRDTCLTSKIAAPIINELFKTNSVNLLGSEKWAAARHSA